MSGEACVIREQPLTAASVSHQTCWSPAPENGSWDAIAVTVLPFSGQPQNNRSFRGDSVWERLGVVDPYHRGLTHRA